MASCLKRQRDAKQVRLDHERLAPRRHERCGNHPPKFRWYDEPCGAVPWSLAITGNLVA